MFSKQKLAVISDVKKKIYKSIVRSLRL